MRVENPMFTHLTELACSSLEKSTELSAGSIAENERLLTPPHRILPESLAMHDHYIYSLSLG